MYRPMLILFAIVALGSFGCFGLDDDKDEGNSEDGDESEDDDQSDKQCSDERTELSDTDGAVTRAAAWIERSYPIEGLFSGEEWPGATVLSRESVIGEVKVALSSGSPVLVSGCGSRGIEVPVQVEVSTEDGALAEVAPGTVVLPENVLTASEPDVEYDREAELTASLGMAQLVGNLTWSETEEWVADRGVLQASLTPFGSRGLFAVTWASREPSQALEVDAPPPPASTTVFSWPGETVCGDTEGAMTLAGEAEEFQTLAARLEELRGDSFSASYLGSSTAEPATELSFNLLLPKDACEFDRLPTRALLTTDDGKLDFTLDVALDPHQDGLYFGTRYDIAYAFTPERFTERVGPVAEDITRFAYVGAELWFHRQEEAEGGLEILGWKADECAMCENQGCLECSAEKRTLIKKLVIGAGE